MLRRLTTQILVVSTAIFGTACVGMHSMATSHLASLPGPGRAEIAVSPGLTYERRTQDSTSGAASSSETATLLGFPALEGNVSYGLGESIGLNLHLSPGGFQPGVQIVLVNGPLSLAILPEVAVARGRISVSGSDSSSTEVTEDGIGYQAGAKALASHTSGLFISAGYDYQFLKLTVENGSGGGSSSDSSLSQKAHNITAGIGYSIRANGFSIRPEVAFLYAPSGAQEMRSSGESFTTKLSSWAVMPMLTLAATSGR